MRRFLLASAVAMLAAPAFAQGAGPFTVAESGQSFASLQDAVSAIGGGQGTIRIAPGRYGECAVQTEGRVSFVAEQPGEAIFDGAICEGKATLVLRGQSARVDGVVFTHTTVDDGNGAGIRLEQGDLAVVNTMFLDGQCGILSANEWAATLTIEHSTFSGLGKDPTGAGAHSLYIGGTGNLRVLRSRFERGTGGHYVKTRVPRIEILDNSFDDSQGRETNYTIDLSNGASGRIAGNSFEIGANKENYSTVITVAPEGVGNSSAGLVVENNRAWLSPNVEFTTTFVGNWSRDAVTVRGNELGKGIAMMARR